VTDLIDSYRALHAANTGYGTTGIKRLPYIMPYIQLAAPWTAVDYGCGRSAVADLVGAAAECAVTRYDPAIPEYAAPVPGRRDLLLSIDVLEHIPEHELDAVLRDMASIAEKAIIVIDTKLATTLLPDGRNAHVTVRSPEWWQARLGMHYPVVPRIWVWKRPAAFVTWRVGALDSARIRAIAAAAWLRRVSGLA
jgi:hypothetical protein